MAKKGFTKKNLELAERACKKLNDKVSKSYNSIKQGPTITFSSEKITIDFRNIKEAQGKTIEVIAHVGPGAQA
jgi:ASC-1-like (ASCH) protein